MDYLSNWQINYQYPYNSSYVPLMYDNARFTNYNEYDRYLNRNLKNYDYDINNNFNAYSRTIRPYYNNAQFYSDNYFARNSYQVPEHQSRKAMYFNYDPYYYQQPYIKYGKLQNKKRYKPHYKSDYDIVLNGLPQAHIDDKNYLIHRSYSVPEDEFLQYNYNSQYYDVHKNYLYNNVANQVYNQYLPSVQPVLYDNPYYVGVPYKSKSRVRQKEASLSSLKSAYSLESLLDARKKGNVKNPGYVIDPYGRYVYETKVKEVNDKKKAPNASQIPVKKETKPTPKVEVEKKAQSDDSKSSDSEDSSSESSSDDNEDVKKKETTRQQGAAQFAADQNQHRQAPVHQPQYHQYQQQHQQQHRSRIDPYAQQKDNFYRNAGYNQRRQNGPPIFIPPDPEKLLRPTLRGAPTGFPNSNQNYKTTPTTTQQTATTATTETTTATSKSEELIIKSEVDKLREEVDDLEKQLSNLKKEFSSSNNASGESLNENTETKNVTAEFKSEHQNNNEADTKKDEVLIETTKTSGGNEKEENDDDDGNSYESEDDDEDEEESDNEESEDDDETESGGTKSNSQTTNTATSRTSSTEKVQKPQPQPQVQQQRTPAKENAFLNQTKNVNKNIWLQPGQRSSNIYQQHYGFYDYYDIDPHKNHRPFGKSHHRLPGNDYNLPYANRNDLYASHQHHQHHQHHHHHHHYHQQPQQPKYNYYNYPKYNKYTDYQHNDYQIYSMHGLNKPEADKKPAKLEKSSKVQKSTNNLIDQRQDPKKVFGPSERTIQAETKKKDVPIDAKYINSGDATYSSNVNVSKKRYNSDKASVAGSIFDVPLPSDNVSEYSAFVNNVFSKALEK